MNTPMSAISGLSGAAARAGPTAEAVAVVAQRLAGIGQELEGLRLQLGQLNAMDWRSPAAAAYRDSLAERNLALAVVAQEILAAVAALGSYGLCLESPPGDGVGLGMQWPLP
ncbi:hypothetical protein ACX80E_10080 [Arthrobacter sp. TMN-49]